MKKAMIPLIIVLMIGAWGSFIYNLVQNPKEWKECIAKGDTYYEQELYFNARNAYLEAEEMKSEYETQLKIANTYYKLGENESYISSLASLIENYPGKIKLYEKLAKEYDKQQLYNDLVRFLNTSEEQIQKSEVLTKLYDKVEKMYDFSLEDYADIKFFTNGVAAVKITNYRIENEDLNKKDDTEEIKEDYRDIWKLVNVSGDTIFQEPYEDIAVSEDGQTCFVKGLDGEWCLINTSNYKIARNEERHFDTIGPMSNIGIATAVLYGKYCFINQEMKVAEVDYDYAANFSEGINAVQKKDKWAIVTGETWGAVTEYPYEDVAINLEGNCCVQGNIVVKQNGKYSIVNQELEPVSENTYEQLKCFESDQPTVYIKDGKAGFVNRYGDIYIEAQYEDALPFKNGYAAVKQDGKWGYINKDNQMVVEPQYIKALPISTTGVGYVQIEEETWGRVTMYLLWYRQE